MTFSAKKVGIITSIVLATLLAVVLLPYPSNSILVQGLRALGILTPVNSEIPVSNKPIDAATLAGKSGLYYLNAANLTGVIDPERFSAYDSLVAEGKIDPDSVIQTDKNSTSTPSSTPSNLDEELDALRVEMAQEYVSSVEAGLGLAGGGGNGATQLNVVPGEGIIIQNDQVVAILGDSIDLLSEVAGVLAIAHGGTGLSAPLPAGKILTSTGSGYAAGTLAAGDGVILQVSGNTYTYEVDTTVCRTSGNCSGSGGSIVGGGSAGQLAFFTDGSTLSSSAGLAWNSGTSRLTITGSINSTGGYLVNGVNLSTSHVLEGSNLYWTQGRFDTAFGNKTTTNLAEGTGLYWTNTRFDSRLATKSTSDLVEGSRLYYTDTRVSANVDVAANTAARHAAATILDSATLNLSIVGQQISGSVIQSGLQTSLLNNDAGFIVNLTGFDTDDLAEGTTNRYFSDVLFGTSLATRDTDDLAEGLANFYFTQTRFDTAFSVKSTTNLSEGTNLYWTQLRFDTAFTAKDTDDLSEGLTNLYYTQARFDASLATKDADDVAEGTTNQYFTALRFDTAFDGKTTDDLTEGLTALYWSNARFDSQLATKDTDDLAEGVTNLYYTDTRVSANADVAANTAARHAAATVLDSTTLDLSITGQQISGSVIQSGLSLSLMNNDAGFVVNLSSFDTDDLVEGVANFYFTQGRFDTAFTAKDTDDLAEGTTNLYSQWANNTTNITFGNSVGIGAATAPTTTLDVTGTFKVSGAVTLSNFTTNGGILYTNGSGLVAQLSAGGSGQCLVSNGAGSAPSWAGCADAGTLTGSGVAGQLAYFSSANSLSGSAELVWNSVDSDFEVAGDVDVTGGYLVNGVALSTSNVVEGTGLYWTDTRFDSRLATKDSDDLAEGITNLYYTDTRVSANADVAANTAARHAAATVSDSSTLDLTLVGQQISGSVIQSGLQTSLMNNDAGFVANLSSFDTDDLAEGLTNFYFTQGRFDTAFSGKDTDDLAEGATNLYSQWANNTTNITFGNSVGIGAATAPTATLDLTGSFKASGAITFSSFTANGGILYTNGSGVVAQTTVGGVGECLKSAGGGAPTWGSCATSSAITGTGVAGQVAFFDSSSNIAGDTSLTWNSTTNVLSVNGSISMTGDIIPSVNDTYSLGSATFMWQDVYIGPGSLYINGQKVLQESGESIVVSADPGQNLSLTTAGGGDLELTAAGGGIIQLKSNVQVTGGTSITTSDTTAVLLPNGIRAGNVQVLGNAVTTTNLNGDIAFTPNGAGDSYFTTGNLGVGNSNPGYRLDVTGSINASTGYLLNGVALSTTNIVEGTNLYWTQSRFNTAFDGKTTDDLTEGVTALYWTDGRFDSRLGTKDTDDLAEGATNLYYTDTRVSANTDVAANTAARHAAATVLDSATLDLSITGQQISGSVIQSGLSLSLMNNDAGFIANLSGFDSDDLAEGVTNFYFTSGRFDTAFSGKDTDDLAEGATNLYSQWANNTTNITFGNSVGIGAATAPTATLDVTGTFKVSGGATLSAMTTNGGLLYTNSSGVLAQTAAGTGSQCLLGGTTPTWGACDPADNVTGSGASGRVAFWNGTNTQSASDTFNWNSSTRTLTLGKATFPTQTSGALSVYGDAWYEIGTLTGERLSFNRSQWADYSIDAGVGSAFRFGQNSYEPLNCDTESELVLDFSAYGTSRLAFCNLGGAGGPHAVFRDNSAAASRAEIYSNAGIQLSATDDVTIAGTSDVVIAGGGLTIANGLTLTAGALSLPADSVTDAMVANTLTASIFAGSGSTSNAVDLGTAEVGGVLGIANGGTNSTATPTDGGIAYGDGAGLAYTSVGAGGQCLTSNGTDAPSWGSCGGESTTVSDTATLDLTLIGQQISGTVIQSGLQTSLLNNDAGFIVNLSGFDTDDLAEGTTNRYFSDALFGTSLATRDTDDLAEGVTNLYYTQARFDSAFSGKSTTNLAEGTNLYWTALRFDTAFSGKDTDDLAEGVTNLYYSDALVSANSDVVANTAARHDAATVLDSLTIDFSISGQQITGSVLADSLNFSELADALTLDASTSIGLGANNLSTSGTGGITLGHTGVTSIAGQVGLGTSSPHARLDLADGGANGSFLIGADVNATTRTTNTRKIGRIVAPNYADDGTGFNIFVLGADTNSTDNMIDFGGVASGTPYAATKIRFYTAANNTTQGGTEAMQINNSQNVGIGLTPGAIHRLHVRATSNQFRADYDASNAFALSVNSTGQVTMDAIGSGAAFVLSDGLTVSGSLTASGATTLSNYTTNGGLLYTNSSGVVTQTTVGSLGQCLQSNGGGAPTWGTCYSVAADSLNFTELADALTLDAVTSIALGSNTLSTTGVGSVAFNHTGNTTFAGNVGIGESNPTEALEVVGNGVISGSLTAPSILASTSGNVIKNTPAAVATVQSQTSVYNDSPNYIAVGPDNFSRILYFDNGYSDLKYVRCLDEYCQSVTNTIVATNVNDIDFPTLDIAPDGFARILYSTYDTPNQLRMIQCLDADCATKTDTLVTSTTNDYAYEKAIDIAADGTARIIFSDYTYNSVYDVKYVQCTNASCSTSVITTVATDTTGATAQDLAIGSDGFARLVYRDHNGTNNDLVFAQCTNADCSTKTTTTLDTSDSYYYYSVIEMGSDGFARISYYDYVSSPASRSIEFVQCSNADCSTRTTNTVATFSSNFTSSMALDGNDLPHFGFGESGIGVMYKKCTSADCSATTNTVYLGEYYYPVSIALDQNDVPVLAHTSLDRTEVMHTKVVSEDGKYIINGDGSALGAVAAAFDELFVSQINGDDLYIAENAEIGNNLEVINNVKINGKLSLGVDAAINKLDVNGGVAIGSYAGVNAAPSNGLVVSGKVGIGTATPKYSLDVAGEFASSATTLTVSGSGVIMAGAAENLLYKVGAVNLSTASVISGTMTKTSLGGGKYKLENTGASYATLRMYVDLADLVDGATYAYGVSYENKTGTGSLYTDWNDSAYTYAAIADTSGRLTNSGSRADYTSTYHFLDISIGPGMTVDVFHEQVEAGSVSTPFTNSSRSAGDLVASGALTIQGTGSSSIGGSLTIENGLTVAAGTVSLPTGSVAAATLVADSLNFTEVSDTLALDASTSIDLGANTLSTSGTGGVTFGHTGDTTFAGDVTISSLSGGNFVFADGSGKLSDSGIDASMLQDGVITTPSINDGSFMSTAYGNGTYVAVGIAGTQAIYSTDGETWNRTTVPDTSAWRSVTYGNGVFVAVAYNGTNRVMTSPDGITWTARTAAEQNGWRSVIYAGGQFVAVAQDGTNRVMTSPDGITWTARAAAEANDWRAVTYGGGQYVAVGISGTNRVMTSPDGITWTARAAAEANTWIGVTYGNSLFVAVSTTGTNRIMTSPDGITWTARSAPEANLWYGVTYANSLFVGVSISGTNRVMTSPDGITWTARSTPGYAYGISYGNGLFVASGDTSNYRIATSPDGITWDNTSPHYVVNGEGITFQGTGAIQFTQQGGTSFINAPVVTTGSNLVTNGTFDTDASGWTLEDCVLWSSGQVTGTYTSCSDVSTTTSISVEQGKTYELAFDVTVTGDDFYWSVPGKSGSVVSGHAVERFVATATGVQTLYMALNNWNTDASYTLDNVTVYEVTGGIGQPLRITDYDGNGLLVLGGLHDNDNVGIGRKVLSALSATGARNTALGSYSLSQNTSGSNNTALGFNGLALNTTGSSNVAVGGLSLSKNISGSNNTAVGYNALSENTASNNTAVGFEALKLNTTGTLNVALGSRALTSNTTGSYNIGIGYNALQANESSLNNIAIGRYTLSNHVSGNANIAIGSDALESNVNGALNVAIGYSALSENISGQGNISIGYISSIGLTSGANNTVVGRWAMPTNTTGSSNVALGNAALTYLNPGGSITAYAANGGATTVTSNAHGLSNGMSVVIAGTTSYNGTFTVSNVTANTFDIAQVFVANDATGTWDASASQGRFNVGLGVSAGQNNKLGEKNVFIGYMAGGDELGSNKLYIANSNTPTPLIYGDFASSALTVNGSLTVTGVTTMANLASSASTTEGSIYYDTDDDQLKVYANGKWQADRSSVTKIVAANDSQNKEKADYVADGTADDVEIQAAIDALPAGGGSVVLLDGNYSISTAISVTKDNTKIVGQGTNTSLSRSNSGNILTVAGTSGDHVTDVTISFLKVSGPSVVGAQVTGSGIYLDYTDRVTIDGVSGNGFGSLESDGAIAIVRSTYCTVQNSNLSASKNGVVTGLATDISYTVSHCTIHNNRAFSNYDDGIHTQHSSLIAITNNHAYNNGTSGGDSAGIDTLGDVNDTIAGNVVTGTTQKGIEVGNSTSVGVPDSGHTITANTVSDNGTDGILIANNAEEITISSNTSRNNGGHGISLGTSSTTREVVDSMVIGNIVTGNGTDGIRLTGNSHRNTVVDNVALSNSNRGMSITVASTETPDANVVEHNRFASNTVSQFSNAGTNTIIRFNVGTTFDIQVNNGDTALDVDGTLTASGAITFSSFSTDGGILYTNGSGVLAQTAAGSLGDCLQSNGGGAPTWGSCGGGITADSLDFDDFADALTLDASTSINLGSNTLSTSGTGGITFGHTGATTFAGNVDIAGVLSTNNSTGGSVQFYSDTDAWWWIDNDGGTLRFSSAANPTDTNAVIISSAGYLGIGDDTGDPEFALDVEGTVKVGGNTQGSLLLQPDNGGAWFWADNNDGILRFSSGASATDANAMVFTSEGKLGIGTTAPSDTLTIQNSTGSNSVGSEKVTNGDFTSAAGWSFGSIWSHDAVNGEADINGNDFTQKLQQDTGEVAGEIYRVTFTIKNYVSGNLYVSIGNTWSTGYTANGTYTADIYAQTTDDLWFAEGGAGTFQGSVDDVSVKKVNFDVSTPLIALNYSDGSTALEIRTGNDGLLNTFIGTSAGESNLTGLSSVGLGVNALAANTIGNYNVAIGKDALKTNTSGDDSVAIGYRALEFSTDTWSNVAIGREALRYNTNGGRNVAIGRDALWSNTTGQENVGLGTYTLGGNQQGNYNTALGSYALSGTVSGDSNVAVGRYAMCSNVSGDDNIAIGEFAGCTISSGSRNIIIGADMEPASGTASDQLNIGDLITGNMAVGSEALTISGSVAVTNGFTVSGGSITLPSGSVAAAAIVADSLNFTEFADTLTLDVPTTISLGSNTLTFGGTAGIDFGQTGTTTFSGGNVVIGSGSDTITMSSAGMVLAGTARHSKTITISPEFNNSTFIADGSVNTDGNMTTENTNSSATNFRNYYEWVSTQATLQDYTIAVRVTLPSDFDAWDTTGVSLFYQTGTANTADNAVSFKLYEVSDGTNIVCDNSTDRASTTWTSANMTCAGSVLNDNVSSEWDAAGETALIKIKVKANSTASALARVGEIVLNYKAKF